MGLVPKPAFTAGELDPSLWERTTLDKYRTGMATVRNWIISKTGSLLTRPGRQHFAQCRYVDRSVRLYSPPGSGVLLEWGHEYVGIYSLTTWALIRTVSHALTEDDLENIHFDTSGSYVYVFCAGKNVLKLNYLVGAFVAPNFVFNIPASPVGAGLTAYGAPTGHPVQYAISYVYDGQESLLYELASSTNLPITSGESVAVGGTLTLKAATVNPNPHVTEMKVYRRPYDAIAGAASGAYGYIGSSSKITVFGIFLVALFTDIGQDADYSQQPPSSLMPADTTSAAGNPQDPSDLLSSTGLVYQQRLLITDYVTDLEAIYASQPGFQNNFRRNYPLDPASSLKFKCGTSGYARILRMLDSDGLVAFTAAGVYLNQGPLTPDNITMNKKGKWVINPIVPPLAVPGGVMFLDRATNGIRNLLWSFELNGYDADEVSIYSNHLFRSRELRTWNFQEGAFPLLWITFTDGIAAAFTFDYNQQMRAWTRHDSQLLIDSCCGTTNADQTFFVVKKENDDGTVTRYIEVTLPRYVPPQYIELDPNYDKNPSCAYMDGITSAKILYNDLLAGDDIFEFAAAEHSTDEEGHPLPDWGGILNLTCGTSDAFASLVSSPPTTLSDIVWRFFDDNGSAIDVVLLEIVDANLVKVQVQNVEEFPEEYASSGLLLYLTFNYITGLDYLEGEYPAVIVDGAVVASPNNDQENYAQLQVNGGRLDLPASKRAAIVHIGRPIIGDVETLDIDTVEQSPTLIESVTVNKVYIKVKDARSLYVGPKFPNGGSGESVDGVTNMFPVESLSVDYSEANPIIANRNMPAQTKRFELTLQGDYSRQGKICIRQVDPLHAEILSFIPDVEVERRSDR